MAVNSKLLKLSSKSKQSFSSQDRSKAKITLRERQEKKYHFPDFDIRSMLEELLKNKLIQLPEMKRLEEADKVNDPN